MATVHRIREINDSANNRMNTKMEKLENEKEREREREGGEMAKRLTWRS